MFFFIFCENFHKIFSARQSFRLKINDEIPKNRTFFKKNAIFIFSARKKLGIFPEFFRIRFLFKKSADRAVAFLRCFQQVQVSMIPTFFLNFSEFDFYLKNPLIEPWLFCKNRKSFFCRFFSFLLFLF